ncbi:MAG: DUF2079 domain-containing protein [Flavobacteriaceae bacterium]|nr:DUF2079 domain-containing protein [Flavobacteriaceae bacterium]
MSLFEGKSRWPFVVIVTLFALVFGSITFVNHYLFRTYALDLGMFNQALYCFSHGNENIFTLSLEKQTVHFFATHFSPIIFLFVPLHFVFGSYTFLVVQWLALLLGGIGMYRLAGHVLESKNKYLPEFILLHFYSIWGIYSALAFDFHHNVIGAMLLPWFLYFLITKRNRPSILFFLLILCCQENMALWMFFVMLALMMMGWRRKSLDATTGKTYLLFLGASLVYFIIVSQWVMPAFQHSERNLQYMRYSHMGESPWEMLKYLLSNPGQIVQLLFGDTYGQHWYHKIKLTAHAMILLSGGWLLFARPFIFLMLLPIYAQKFFADNLDFWGINLQYSIEFVPILSYVLIDFIRNKSNRGAMAISITVVVLSLAINLTSIALKNYDSGINVSFFKQRHYCSPLFVSEINDLLKQIPADVPVSASTNLIPHIANREHLYHFPTIKDAEYILVLTKHNVTYPVGQVVFDRILDSCRKMNGFEKVTEKADLLILRKKQD